MDGGGNLSDGIMMMTCVKGGDWGMNLGGARHLRGMRRSERIRGVEGEGEFGGMI